MPINKINKILGKSRRILIVKEQSIDIYIYENNIVNFQKEIIIPSDEVLNKKFDINQYISNFGDNDIIILNLNNIYIEYKALQATKLTASQTQNIAINSVDKSESRIYAYNLIKAQSLSETRYISIFKVPYEGKNTIEMAIANEIYTKVPKQINLFFLSNLFAFFESVNNKSVKINIIIENGNISVSVTIKNSFLLIRKINHHNKFKIEKTISKIIQTTIQYIRTNFAIDINDIQSNIFYNKNELTILKENLSHNDTIHYGIYPEENNEAMIKEILSFLLKNKMECKLLDVVTTDILKKRKFIKIFKIINTVILLLGCIFTLFFFQKAIQVTSSGKDQIKAIDSKIIQLKQNYSVIENKDIPDSQSMNIIVSRLILNFFEDNEKIFKPITSLLHKTKININKDISVTAYSFEIINEESKIFKLTVKFKIFNEDGYFSSMNEKYQFIKNDLIDIVLSQELSKYSGIRYEISELKRKFSTSPDYNEYNGSFSITNEDIISKFRK